MGDEVGGVAGREGDGLIGAVVGPRDGDDFGGGIVKAVAEAEIVAAANRAKEDLRKQVSTLAVTGAEKLLRREIDANAHKALLDELAAEI